MNTLREWGVNFLLCSGAPLGQTLCDPMVCSSPGSSVHGILQARILEWVAISYSEGSSPPRDWTLGQLCLLNCRGEFLPLAPPGKAIFTRMSEKLSVELCPCQESRTWRQTCSEKPANTPARRATRVMLQRLKHLPFSGRAQPGHGLWRAPAPAISAHVWAQAGHCPPPLTRSPLPRFLLSFLNLKLKEIAADL